MPKSRDHEQAPLDPAGAVLSTVGIVALVYGLIEAPNSGWLSAATLGSFAAAAAVLAAFVAWELRTEHPTLEIRYFLNRAFSIGTGGMILVFLALYGVIFLLTLYFQLVLGYSALSTAVRFVPIALIMIAVAPQTPRLTARFGAHRAVGAGMVMVAAGLLGLMGLGLHTTYLYVVVCLVPIVGGMAMSISPMTASIMSAVPPRRAGAGSAMNDTTRELGAALGVAVLGSLAASRYASGLGGPLRALAPAARATARSSLAGALQVAASLPRAAGATLARTANLAFVDGFHLAGVVGAALAALSAVIVVRYLPRRLTQSDALPMDLDLEELALEALMLEYADLGYPEGEAEPAVG